jgi:AraC-like DNA-binding protein
MGRFMTYVLPVLIKRRLKNSPIIILKSNMPKVINKQAVIEMKKQGFTCKQIAERLGCSERQVKRITKGMPRGKFIDSETEKISREFLSAFMPGAAVALRFGVTRQAIQQENS